MCGIAGVISHAKQAKSYKHKLGYILKSIQHRGPNETNAFFSNSVLLGNVRLSINDLYHKTQPAESNNVYTVFNGEIYNYKELKTLILNKGYCLKTTCDTELIPILYNIYGHSFIDKLDGQFAIAIYDINNRKVFLYRDRLGKKPLFYCYHDDCLFFSSEITPLKNMCNSEIDMHAVAMLSALWTTNGNHYKGIYPVKDGEYIEIACDDIMQLRKVKYWSLANVLRSKKLNLSSQEAETLVFTKIKDSVQKRTTTDVGYGLYLSGGLDSTILAYHLALISNKTNAYSIEFENEEYDESKYQQIVADYFGLTRHGLKIKNDDIYNNFNSFVEKTSQILFRTAPIPMYLLSGLASSKNEKVIFSGEGSDELFFGYDLYREVKFANYAKNKSSNVQNILIKKLYPYLLSDQQLEFVKYSLLNNSGFGHFESHKLRLKNLAAFNKYVHERVSYSDLDYTDFIDIEHLDYMDKARLIEYKTLLSGYLLNVQGDLPAMQHSIELRCPFTDYGLIETVASIETKTIFPKLEEKNILKRIYKDKIPNEILERYKQPYRAPDANIFYQKNEVIDQINDFSTFGFFNKDMCMVLAKKIVDKSNVSYLDSFVFIIIYSTLILMNQKNIVNFDDEIQYYHIKEI